MCDGRAIPVILLQGWADPTKVGIRISFGNQNCAFQIIIRMIMSIEEKGNVDFFST